jgi:hypothetical protein
MTKYIIRIGIITQTEGYKLLDEIFTSKKHRDEWIQRTEIYKNLDNNDDISYGYEVDGLVYWTRNKSTPINQVIEAQKRNAEIPNYINAQYHERVTA